MFDSLNLWTHPNITFFFRYHVHIKSLLYTLVQFGCCRTEEEAVYDEDVVEEGIVEDAQFASTPTR